MSRRLGKIEFAEKAQKAVDKYCADHATSVLAARLEARQYQA